MILNTPSPIDLLLQLPLELRLKGLPLVPQVFLGFVGPSLSLHAQLVEILVQEGACTFEIDVFSLRLGCARGRELFLQLIFVIPTQMYPNCACVCVCVCV